MVSKPEKAEGRCRSLIRFKGRHPSLEALAAEAERVKNPIGSYRGIKIAR